MVKDDHFKKQLIGAINSYIRMINQYNKYNREGLGIISNEWYSQLIEEGNTFQAILIINGTSKIITFTKDEWRKINVNIFSNVQLKELYSQYSCP